jgi:hypothetical protein
MVWTCRSGSLENQIHPIYWMSHRIASADDQFFVTVVLC